MFIHRWDLSLARFDNRSRKPSLLPGIPWLRMGVAAIHAHLQDLGVGSSNLDRPALMSWDAGVLSVI